MKKCLLTLVLLICVVGQVQVFAQSIGYVLTNDKVQPVQKQGVALNARELSSVVFDHQESIQSLKQELSRTRQDVRELQQELKDVRSEFSQFKNLYFRRF